jgi:formylmethanofuran dehydrogenase subunit C
MTAWVLRSKHAPALRLDLRSIAPETLAGLSAAQVQRLPLPHGRDRIALADLFEVTTGAGADDTLVLEGDLRRCDRIGWQLARGRIQVHGDAGDLVGGGMTGGEIDVRGRVGVLAACEMSGGSLRIAGHAGDFAAAALPGSMDGMRGGTLVVQGQAGDRFGDRMRRGTAVVFGDAGDFVGSRMVAGTIAVGGRLGAHCGFGMRRGSIVCVGTAPDIGPTFVPTQADIAVFWQLLARALAPFGAPFDGLAQRVVQRYLGDRGSAGTGELLLPR